MKVGDFVIGGVPVVRGGDIREGRVRFDDEKRVSQAVSEQYRRTILRGGEIVVNLIAEPGHSAVVPPELAGANVSRDVAVIALNDRADHSYVNYVLKSPLAVEWLTARLNGSVTQKINLGTLRELPVPLPDRREQRAIATVLGALDDKIDLNRRTNETLEDTARALFKSWFVDFDPVRAKAEGRQPFGMDAATAALFPGGFEDSELGEVPRGWKVVPLGSLLSLDKGVSYKGEFLTDAGSPMINLGCFGGDGRFLADRVKGYAGDVRPQHWVREGDLVLANTDMTQNRVILGSPALVPPIDGHDRALFSHHVYAARPHEDDPSMRLYFYYALLQPEFRRRAAGFATGTTVLALPRDAVLALACVIPPAELRHAFGHVAGPLRARTQAGLVESRRLAALRDYLLPKLLSGEVRVRDAEKLVEAAT